MSSKVKCVILYGYYDTENNGVPSVVGSLPSEQLDIIEVEKEYLYEYTRAAQENGCTLVGFADKVSLEKILATAKNYVDQRKILIQREEERQRVAKEKARKAREKKEAKRREQTEKEERELYEKLSKKFEESKGE